MKKVIQILIFLLLCIYLVFAIGFTSDKRAETKCNGIKVEITDGDSYRFFDNKDVDRILNANGYNIIGKTIAEINTWAMEETFRKNSYVRKVDIFTTMNGTLTIKIRQRIPQIRIITSGGGTWYMDKDGFIMPASRKFSPHILVANGDFNMGNQLRETMSLNDVKDKRFYKPWFDALILGRYINNDDFLKAQVVQLYLNSKNEFELIPRVGAHQIILGDASDLENKFYKLNIFYREGLNNVGWNKYQKIDLRFKNQIICSKR